MQNLVQIYTLRSKVHHALLAAELAHESLYASLAELFLYLKNLEEIARGFTPCEDILPPPLPEMAQLINLPLASVVIEHKGWPLLVHSIEGYGHKRHDLFKALAAVTAKTFTCVCCTNVKSVQTDVDLGEFQAALLASNLCKACFHQVVGRHLPMTNFDDVQVLGPEDFTVSDYAHYSSILPSECDVAMCKECANTTCWAHHEFFEPADPALESLK